MEGNWRPKTLRALVADVEHQAKNEEGDEAMKLKVNQRKESGSKYTPQPNRPRLGEDSVNEPTKEKLLDKGCNDHNEQKSHAQAEEIGPKERQIGILSLITWHSEFGGVQSPSNESRKEKIQGIGKKHGPKQSSKRNALKTKVEQSGIVFSNHKKPEWKAQNHKLHPVVNEERHAGMHALQELRCTWNCREKSNKETVKGNTGCKDLNEVFEPEARFQSVKS